MVESNFVQQLRTSPIEWQRILYQMAKDGDGFWNYKGTVPWDIMDNIEQTGKQCIECLDQMYE